jgi:hypothetical protein
MIRTDANKASLDTTGPDLANPDLANPDLANPDLAGADLAGLGVRRIFAVLLLLLGGVAVAEAGFRTPESLIRNVYAYYGKGAPELSHGLPRDEATTQKFFDPSLRKAWRSASHEPYDFLVQSATWNLGSVSISILRRQFDKTYVAANFDNQGRAVTLNFILVNGPEGWLIADVESPHDSLRMFLEQFKN